jgi:hypothetical protein
VCLHIKVRELTHLVESLKNEKRNLLLKCEGLDEKQMFKEDSLVKKYKAELDRERDLHKHQVEDLTAKVSKDNKDNNNNNNNNNDPPPVCICVYIFYKLLVCIYIYIYIRINNNVYMLYPLC